MPVMNYGEDPMTMNYGSDHQKSNEKTDKPKDKRAVSTKPAVSKADKMDIDKAEESEEGEIAE
jgi:hypothetical protein